MVTIHEQTAIYFIIYQVFQFTTLRRYSIIPFFFAILNLNCYVKFIHIYAATQLNYYLTRISINRVAQYSTNFVQIHAKWPHLACIGYFTCYTNPTFFRRYSLSKHQTTIPNRFHSLLGVYPFTKYSALFNNWRLFFCSS